MFYYCEELATKSFIFDLFDAKIPVQIELVLTEPTDEPTPPNPDVLDYGLINLLDSTHNYVYPIWGKK